MKATTAPFAALMATCGSFEASDLHLHPGCAPRMRVHGELREIEGQAALSAEALEQGLLGMLQPEQRAVLAERGVFDFHHVDGEGVSWR